MYQEPIFLQPVFKERIWGGNKLKQIYGKSLPEGKVGEAWVIAAHEHGSCRVINGPLAGKTLNDLWKENRVLFGKNNVSHMSYPLLVKIIDAHDDLSVQVHPNDAYAQAVEKVPFGKTECWYVLDAEEDASIILGHIAQDKDTFNSLIDEGEWDTLLQRVPVKQGDFFYVPSGTIHAIGKGIVILEIQQSSDITYRVYDYDRLNDDGSKRELHLDKAKAVTCVPHQVVDFVGEKAEKNDLVVTELISEQYFTVYLWEIDGKANQTLAAEFLQVSVIDGKALLLINDKKIEIQKGDHFIMPHGVTNYTLDGKASIIVSHITSND